VAEKKDQREKGGGENPVRSKKHSFLERQKGPTISPWTRKGGQKSCRDPEKKGIFGGIGEKHRESWGAFRAQNSWGKARN